MVSLTLPGISFFNSGFLEGQESGSQELNFGISAEKWQRETKRKGQIGTDIRSGKGKGVFALEVSLQ